MDLYEDLTLTTPDGLRIRAYLMLQGATQQEQETEAKRRPTVLFLHANAGNMVCPLQYGLLGRFVPVQLLIVVIHPAVTGLQGDRLPFAHIFDDRLKCNVFMLSYRG